MHTPSLLIAGCELDMPNSQQGYKWTQSFVFLEAKNGEKAQARSFSTDLSLLTPNTVPNLRELGV